MVSIKLLLAILVAFLSFFFQAEDGIRDRNVTGVQTCALPISAAPARLSFCVLRALCALLRLKTTGRRNSLLIDEKIEQINEQPGGPPAAPPPLTTRDKLRAAWARFQCSSLLRSHRIRTRTRLHAETLGALICALPLARQLGDWLYALGFAGEYTLIRAGRSIRAAALWLAAAFLRGWNNVMDIAFPGARTVLRELFGPVYVFCRGVRNIWLYGDGVRREQGFWAGIVADVQYLGRGAVRYAGLLPRMVVYLLPLAALAVLLTVVQFT